MPVDRRLGDRRGECGQSVAEFALVLPLLLALVGLTIDVARIYEGWIKLEAATRDAAEYLATSSADPLDPDYGATNASAKAKFIVERETGRSFTVNPDQAGCAAAKVSATYSESTATADGASLAHPRATARVVTCQPFQTLFSYPLLTSEGNWIVRSDRSYQLLVGR